MDADGYPEDDELTVIEQWPYAPKDAWLDLLGYVKTIWRWPDFGWIEANTEEGTRLFTLHTGGWSGNEELIGSLMRNTVFWAMCWYESRRGGHFIFEVKQPSGNSIKP